MARKTSADAAKEKAAKQKKMAIGLSVFLVLAMGYAVRTMMSLNSGGSKPVAADTSTTTVPATSTTPAPVTTTPAATPTAAPSLGAPTLSGTPTASAPTTDPTTGAPTTAGSLVTAVVPTAGTGQLESFSEFSSKDPFAAPPKSSGSGGPKKSTPAKAPTKAPTTSGSGTKAPAAAAPTSAVISVNGTAEAVGTGASFPASSPIFQLLSLTKTTAKVTVIGGSYASGAAALTLTVNKPVTLVNTADGTRYTLLLFPQGSTAPAAAPSSGPSATPPATTTPTQTTTN